MLCSPSMGRGQCVDLARKELIVSRSTSVVEGQNAMFTLDGSWLWHRSVMQGVDCILTDESH
jgi:hypothetical protein